MVLRVISVRLPRRSERCPSQLLPLAGRQRLLVVPQRNSMTVRNRSRSVTWDYSATLQHFGDQVEIRVLGTDKAKTQRKQALIPVEQLYLFHHCQYKVLFNFLHVWQHCQTLKRTQNLWLCVDSVLLLEREWL